MAGYGQARAKCGGREAQRGTAAVDVVAPRSVVAETPIQPCKARQVSDGNFRPGGGYMKSDGGSGTRSRVVTRSLYLVNTGGHMGEPRDLWPGRL